MCDIPVITALTCNNNDNVLFLENHHLKTSLTISNCTKGMDNSVTQPFFLFFNKQEFCRIPQGRRNKTKNKTNQNILLGGFKRPTVPLSLGGASKKGFAVGMVLKHTTRVSFIVPLPLVSFFLLPKKIKKKKIQPTTQTHASDSTPPGTVIFRLGNAGANESCNVDS